MLAPYRLSVVPLVALFLGLAACGVEDPAVGSAEYAFKHGPGPGPPYSYFLTTFSGEGMACGGYADGKWYYSTGEWMFRVNGASGCGTKLKLMANNKCVVVEVADNGPADWVEANAKAKCGGTGYILDVSPVVSKALFGVSSSGWSDCRAVQAWVLPSTTPTGPIACGATTPTAWIGDPCAQDAQCTSGKCLTAYSPGGPSFPGGMCTQPCTKLCPDSPGEPTTFCITFDAASGSYSGSQGHCFSQCDTTLFPGSGCRTGYSCVKVARHNDPTTTKDVCLPQQTSTPDGGVPPPPPPPDSSVATPDSGTPQPPPPPPADGAAPPPPQADGGPPLPPAANPPANPPQQRGMDGCAMGRGPRGSPMAGLWLLGLCLTLARRRR